VHRGQDLSAKSGYTPATVLKTSARLLRLLSLLQSRRSWSGQELSERTAVDARTIRRDIDRLRELGYVVRATSGAGGGYQLGAGSAMPPVLLSDDEVVAIAMAIRAAAGTVGRMEEVAVGLLAKLDQLLPARLRKRATALHAVTLSVAHPQASAPIDLLSRMAVACRDCMRIRLNYQDRQGNATVRTIEPLRLAHAGYRWYLVAWDLQRRDWRTFRVDRIERLLSTGPQFEPRKFPGDIASYVSRSITSVPYRYRIRLKLAGSAETLAKRIPSWCGVLEALDSQSCVLNLGADSVESLVAQMALTRSDCTVLDAPEVVAELRKVTERLQRSVR
jgi:predicted DNA-binding transcriptional regulator YafY